MLLKTQENHIILKNESRIYSIIDTLNMGDIFYLPDYCKIIANKDSESPEIFDGGYSYVYQTEGKTKSLYLIKLDGFQQRIEVAQTIDGYLFYCAIFLKWHGEDALKFASLPAEIATDDGLYEYIREMVNKASYEAFRPESNEKQFLELMLKKLRKYLDEYGIVIEDDISLDGYMVEKDEELVLSTKKPKTDSDDDELVVNIEKEDSEFPKCKVCGYIPESKTPKFCPECGTKFE